MESTYANQHVISLHKFPLLEYSQQPTATDNEKRLVMIRLIVVALLVAAIATGWYLYSKVQKARNARRFARKRASDAIAWQKVLDQNAANRASADANTGPA